MEVCSCEFQITIEVRAAPRFSIYAAFGQWNWNPSFGSHNPHCIGPLTRLQGMRKPQAPQAPLAENGGQIRISQKILGRCNKKNNYCNIFLFYYFKIGPLAFQSGTNSRRTTFSGGLGCTFLNLFGRKFCPKKTPVADNLKFSRALSARSKSLLRP